MKTIAIVLIVAATALLAVATAVSSRADLIDGFVRKAIVGKASPEDARSAYLRAPDRDYIAYPGYSAMLPNPSCYWTRMPVYDSNDKVVGWRGRPVAVCP
jgi:hypothetical protein